MPFSCHSITGAGNPCTEHVNDALWPSIVMFSVGGPFITGTAEIINKHSTDSHIIQVSEIPSDPYRKHLNLRL